MALDLTLEAPSQPVIADGPIRLSLEIKNTGTIAMNVPEMDGPSPFRYAIYSADASQLLQTASRLERDLAQPWMSDPPELPQQRFALSSGFTASYEEDLMSLLTQLLEPGSYLLEASYHPPDGEPCTSARVVLDVVVSKPQAIAQDIALSDGRVAIAEWHGNADGTTLLRKRETGLPPLGRFYDLQTYKSSQPVSQCAISLNAAHQIPDYWRWLAWLDGRNLLAGVVHDHRWIYPTKPIALDLDTASLLPLGYTTEDAGAIFIVAGRSGGRRRIRLVRIAPGQDAEPVLEDVQFDNLPDAVPSASCVWSPDRAPELILGWTLEIHGAASIILARVNALSGEMLAPPKGVFTTLRPLAAVSFPTAIGPEDARHAQILLAPGAGESDVTQTLVDISNPALQSSRNLPKPDVASFGAVDRWVLPSEPYPGTPVLAVAGGEIWACDQRGWTRIAIGDLEASSVRLWAFSHRRLLATWFDKHRGYHSHQLQ